MQPAPPPPPPIEPCMLEAPDASARLQAALRAGTEPDVRLLPTLVARCAVEPDFYVREMLTWAIIQLPRDATAPRLRAELDAPRPQARSQALHTLSKIGAPEAWPWVFPTLLIDPDDEVARAAWRVAVGIVPAGREDALARILLGQLGRGDVEVRKSLARALAQLAVIHEPVDDALATAEGSPDAAVAAHAHATRVIVRDPGASFAGALQEAERQRPNG